jgi:hypothetical protein
MKQPNQLLAAVVLALAAVGAAAEVQQKDAEPLAVGSSRQLFVDDRMVAQSANVSRIFHAAVKSERNPILVAEKPWEGTMVDVGTVLYDADDKLFKMWYGALEMHYQPPAPPYHRYENLLKAANYSEHFRPCYATSRDGIHWERPSLGLVEFNGSKDNNLLPSDRRMEYFLGSIYKDARDTNPARRYKSVGYWNDKAGNVGVGASFSPDGLRWTAHPGNPIVRDTSDVHTLLGWDDRIGRYVGYFRPKAKIRIIGYSTSTDFDRWTPIEPSLMPDAQDPVDMQFYGMPPMRYEGFYFGFVWTFRTNEITHIPQLVWSRDGRRWNRTPNREAFLTLGDPGRFDEANAYASRPFVHDGRIWVYYSGTRWRGLVDIFESREKARDAVGLAQLPLDGFVSMQAGPDTGVLTTPRLTFRGRALTLHFDESAKGYAGSRPSLLLVELLDADGKPIPGFSAADADEISSSGLRHVVSWKGRSDVSTLTGRPVRVRFHFQNGKLYAFQFTE